MPALPLQLRLEPHHMTAIDAVATVTDPTSGLTVTLSRQQVIVGILDQWIAARQAPPPVSTPLATAVVQPEPTLADIGRETSTRRAPTTKRKGKAPAKKRPTSADLDAQVLVQVQELGTCACRQITAALGLPNSTVYSSLKRLVAEGMLTKEGETYRVIEPRLDA